MASLSVQPLSADDPCGQDLDFEEDGAYLQFTASTDALLPDAYMQAEGADGKRVPFYAAQRYQNLDLDALLLAGSALLARTHDLRLLAIVAKLRILNRDLVRFAADVATIAALLEDFPQEVHPRAPDMRAGALERLGEPLIISALNHAILFKSRRFGGVSWVSYNAATRADGAGGVEAVDRILRDETKADAESIGEAQRLLNGLADALRRIAAASAAASPPAVPDLQKLAQQIAAIREMLQRVRPTAEGAVAPGGGGADRAASAPGAPSAPAASALPLLPNAEAAEAALAEAERFFAAVEPSSPCLLLLRQAQALAGKSFFEALQALLPSGAEKAVFALGPSRTFDVPLARIAAAASEGAKAPPDRPLTRPSPYPFKAVTSRVEAMALLDEVIAFYRFVEPSSPIPLLVEQARAIGGKDFSALLQAMLPEKSDSNW